MIHERLQADIISKDSLRSLRDATIGARRVRRRGIKLREQEAGLRTTGIADDETREREAVLDELLRVLLRRLQQRAEAVVAFLLLVPCFAPLRHGLAVEDQDVEEGVEQQDRLGLDRCRVK